MKIKAFFLILTMFSVFSITVVCRNILKDPKKSIVKNYSENKIKLKELVNLFLSQKKVYIFRIDGPKSFRLNDTEINIYKNEYEERYILDRPQRQFASLEQVLDYYKVSKDTFNLFNNKLREVKCKSIGYTRNNPNNVELGFGDMLSGPSAYGLIYVPEGSSEKASKDWVIDYFRIEPIDKQWFYFCE